VTAANVLVALAAAGGLFLVLSAFLWPRRPRIRSRAPVLAPLRERLVQAGLARVTPGILIAVSLVLGVLALTLVFALSTVLALAVAAAAVALVAPFLAVGWRARARRRATRVVWPDAVDQLVSAVRSGLALPDGLATLAVTGPLGIRGAFAQFEADYRSTANFGVSLDLLKDRLADPVADRILETLRMAREVGGGELTTVLRNLSAYLRQESAIRSEVEARQSWVMNAARLGVAAPWVVLLMLASRPEAALAYNSAAGVSLIVGGLVVSFVAYRIMVGIGRLPEERRWFS
jgi:tight adherence protein B